MIHIEKSEAQMGSCSNRGIGVLASKLRQSGALSGEFLFSFRFLQPLQAAACHEKKQEKNATPVNLMKS
jgi:hypothetical protein